MRKSLIVVVLSILSFGAFSVSAQTQLYRVKLIRAAPGELLNVIELYKDDMKSHANYGIEQPYLMRHSQGDQWDLMLIYPIESMKTHFSKAAMEKRDRSKTLAKKYGDPFFEKVSSHQEAVFEGPAKEQFSKWFEEFGYYHVEIFTALAGKQKELLKQRQMENIYYKVLNRRQNLIFTKVTGPTWDIFTIGFYKNLKDFAKGGGTPEEQEKAAIEAGFEGVNKIGSYLRELLLEHHDTLAGAVRNK